MGSQVHKSSQGNNAHMLARRACLPRTEHFVLQRSVVKLHPRMSGSIGETLCSYYQGAEKNLHTCMQSNHKALPLSLMLPHMIRVFEGGARGDHDSSYMDGDSSSCSRPETKATE